MAGRSTAMFRSHSIPLLYPALASRTFFHGFLSLYFRTQEEDTHILDWNGSGGIPVLVLIVQFDLLFLAFSFRSYLLEPLVFQLGKRYDKGMISTWLSNLI